MHLHGTMVLEFVWYFEYFDPLSIPLLHLLDPISTHGSHMKLGTESIGNHSSVPILPNTVPNTPSG